MKRKCGLLLGIVLSICMLVCVWNTEAYAATGSLSLSTVSGTVGSTVTVNGTIKASEAFSAVRVVLEYKPSELQYVSGSSNVSGGSGSVQYFADVIGQNKSTLTFSMKFKILKEGTFKVNSTTIDAISDESMAQIAINNASATVTGEVKTTTTPSTPNNNKPQNNKDTNNKLSALQVYPGNLSPAFNGDTTSYTVSVPGDTTEVTISATAASSKATVSVSGGKDLKLGPNEAKVIVVAESGASRAYTITIMCGELEKIQIGGAEYTINENFSDDQIPAGFSRKKATYNSRQYEAVTNASGSLVLMNLKSGENTSFYIYNQEAKEFYDFVQIKFAEGKYIIPLPLNKDVAEFTEYETVVLQIQGKNIDAWKLDEEFSVAYVMNQDGKEVLYKYDSVDVTFQRYNDIKVEDVDQAPIEKTWFPNEYYMYAIVGLGALSLILLIAMIYFIASRKVRHEGRKKKAIKRQEKQRAKEERQREKEARELEKHRQILEEEREKQRQIEEKRTAKQKAKEEKKLAKQKKREE